MTYAAPQLKLKLRLELRLKLEVKLKLKLKSDGGGEVVLWLPHIIHSHCRRGRLGFLDWAFVLTFDWQLTKRRRR